MFQFLIWPNIITIMVHSFVFDSLSNFFCHVCILIFVFYILLTEIVFTYFFVLVTLSLYQYVHTNIRLYSVQKRRRQKREKLLSEIYAFYRTFVLSVVVNVSVVFCCSYSSHRCSFQAYSTFFLKKSNIVHIFMQVVNSKTKDKVLTYFMSLYI